MAWFVAAEAQFTLKRLTSETDRFCLLIAALDKDTLKRVMHKVTHPDPLTPYTALKQELLHSHHLTDFQKVELLLAMDPLGGRKPSELLADMLELCPVGQHNNIFFVHLFLQRLPRETRILLAHENHDDLRALATKADRFLAFSGQSPVVAAVSDDTDVVAALRPGGQRNKFAKPPPIPPRPQQHAGAAQSTAPAPVKVAQQATGLCYYHWTYGEKATKCRKPCSWQPGN